MRCIILGFGRVGRPTAQRMQDAGHDVTVIENDDGKFEAIRKRGLTLVEGDGSDEAVLERADLATADAVAALTDDLDTNLAACSAASEAGCRTVLRISQEISDADYERYSGQVDEVIYPERVGAAAAKTALLGGDFNVISSLTEELSIASVSVPEGAPVVGERVVNVDLPGETRIYAHGREGEDMSVPLPQTRFEPGDSVAVMVDSSMLQDVRATIRGL
ncbi:TrkA family potassium uptake protein [Salinibaculum marinum]|uniref:potassium channel family protein n=1 Tax=Salinibaculum marinum TaxID=3131993 RepID=UPI0030D3A304